MAKYLNGEDGAAEVDATLDIFKQSYSGLVYEALSGPLEDEDDSDSSMEGSFVLDGVQLRSEDFVSVTSIPMDPLAAILLEKARISLANCDSYARRLDLYAEAAERGSAEALYLWGMMVKYGTESGNTQCGSASTDDVRRSSIARSTGVAIKHWFTSTSSTVSDGGIESDRSTYAFMVAADMGCAAALVPLAFALLHGSGIGPITRNPLAKVPTTLNIPLHPSFIAESGGPNAYYRLSKLHFSMSKALLQYHPRRANESRHKTDTKKTATTSSLASSVIDRESYPPSAMDGDNSNVNTSSGSHVVVDDTDAFPSISATALAIGMLHLAAMHGIPEAHKTLAYRSVSHSIG